MKFKWVFPFMPFSLVILSDPQVSRPVEVRWFMIIGSLIVVGIYLGIIQPWQPDDKWKSR